MIWGVSLRSLTLTTSNRGGPASAHVEVIAGGGVRPERANVERRPDVDAGVRDRPVGGDLEDASYARRSRSRRLDGVDEVVARVVADRVVRQIGDWAADRGEADRAAALRGAVELRRRPLRDEDGRVRRVERDRRCGRCGRADGERGDAEEQRQQREPAAPGHSRCLRRPCVQRPAIRNPTLRLTLPSLSQREDALRAFENCTACGS